MAGEPGTVGWRVFPWDPPAPAREPFSAGFVPSAQGSGRFDLGTVPVLYLAESPAHAVGEVLQSFRGRRLHAAHLRRFGHALAVVDVTLPDDAAAGLADLTDPAVLGRHHLRPDTLASRDVQRTQAVSRALHGAGYPGFRWWSSLSGDWHATVLFLDRVLPHRLAWGAPQALALPHPAVADAALELGIRL